MDDLDFMTARELSAVLLELRDLSNYSDWLRRCLWLWEVERDLFPAPLKQIVSRLEVEEVEVKEVLVIL